MQNKRDQCVAASTLKIFLNFYLILDKKGFIFAHTQIPSYSYLKFCDYVLQALRVKVQSTKFTKNTLPFSREFSFSVFKFFTLLSIYNEQKKRKNQIVFLSYHPLTISNDWSWLICFKQHRKYNLLNFVTFFYLLLIIF